MKSKHPLGPVIPPVPQQKINTIGYFLSTFNN